MENVSVNVARSMVPWLRKEPAALAKMPVPETIVSTSLTWQTAGFFPAGAQTALSEVVNVPGRDGSVETKVCCRVMCCAPWPVEPDASREVTYELSIPGTFPNVTAPGRNPRVKTPGAGSTIANGPLASA